MLTIVIIVALLFGLLAVYIFVNRFAKPIEELDRLFSIGAKGDLTIRFTPKTRDEIGRLGSSFNRMMDKIKTLTQYDPLTTLLNQYVLEKDILSVQRNGNKENFSLIMIAIDKLSHINGAYGYMAGDIILCISAAERISRILNENYKL